MARLLLAPLAVLAAVMGGLWLFAGQLGGGRWTAVAAAVAWMFALSALLARIGRRHPGLKRPTRWTFGVAAVVASLGFYWTSIRDTTVNETVVMASERVDDAEREAALRPAVPAARPAAAPRTARRTRATPTRPAAAVTPAPRPARSRRQRPKPQRPRPKATPAPAATSTPEAAAELSRGVFTGADDHDAEGRATLVRLPGGERELTFTGFDVEAGPDVRVYLVPGEGSSVEDHVELGRLKGSRGNQSYHVPADVDLVRYTTVVLWCIPFTTRIGVAPLA